MIEKDIAYKALVKGFNIYATIDYYYHLQFNLDYNCTSLNNPKLKTKQNVL